MARMQVAIVDYDKYIFESYSRRRYLGLGKSIFDSLGMASFDLFFYEYKAMPEIDVRLKKTVNLSDQRPGYAIPSSSKRSPGQALEDALSNDPACILVEPFGAGMGLDRSLYNIFTDELAEISRNRALIVWTIDQYLDGGYDRIKICQDKKLAVIGKHDPLLGQHVNLMSKSYQPRDIT